MALSNAERQARYRDRHKATPDPKVASDLAVALRRIAELEEEVRHLKSELATRTSFGFPRPAPKPSRSRSRTSASGRAG